MIVVQRLVRSIRHERAFVDTSLDPNIRLRRDSDDSAEARIALSDQCRTVRRTRDQIIRTGRVTSVTHAEDSADAGGVIRSTAHLNDALDIATMCFDHAGECAHRDKSARITRGRATDGDIVLIIRDEPAVVELRRRRPGHESAEERINVRPRTDHRRIADRTVRKNRSLA